MVQGADGQMHVVQDEDGQMHVVQQDDNEDGSMMQEGLPKLDNEVIRFRLRLQREIRPLFFQRATFCFLKQYQHNLNLFFYHKSNGTKRPYFSNIPSYILASLDLF